MRINQNVAAYNSFRNLSATNTQLGICRGQIAERVIRRNILINTHCWNLLVGRCVSPIRQHPCQRSSSMSAPNPSGLAI